MPYEILPHIADLRLRVWGDTLEQVFCDALQGMTVVQKRDISMAAKQNPRTLNVHSPDPTALLVDFLNEALSLTVIHKEVYPSVVFGKIDETSVKATLYGAPVSEFDEDIKAVTYHEANLVKNDKGEWQTTLVLDI